MKKLSMTIVAAVLAIACMSAFADPPVAVSSAATTAAPPGAVLSLLPFNISVEGYGNLRIKPDVTAEESAWIGLMLSVGLNWKANLAYGPDYAGFIKLHHLERHFDKEPAK